MLSSPSSSDADGTTSAIDGGIMHVFNASCECDSAFMRLMNRLDCSEVEFDSGAYVDGNAFLDALLERYDA